MEPIVFSGDGRWRTVGRPSRIVRCDVYYCGGRWGGCKRNPEHSLPAIPDGYVGIHEMQAAGSLEGYSVRLASEEMGQHKDVELFADFAARCFCYKCSIARAKALFDCGTERRNIEQADVIM